VGYPKGTLEYYLYNRTEGKVFVTQNSVFLEKVSQKGENGEKVYLEEVQDEPVGNDSMSDANVAEQVETSVVVQTHRNHEDQQDFVNCGGIVIVR